MTQGLATSRGFRAAVVLAVLGLLAGCGPVPLAQAERYCVDRARLAQQPRGEVAVGVGSGGRAEGAFSIEVTSDFLTGQDPSAVYETCVRQRAGQAPSRPLSAQPGWTGR
jgi:hypothetical protein